MDIPKTMKAAYMQGVGNITVEETSVPVPGDDELLIRVKAVGICGSDVHLFAHGSLGPYVVHPPYILGHEASGEVAAVGKNVESFKPGDKIAMEPGVPCGKCEHCRSGAYNLCLEVVFWAAPPVPGVLAEYITHKAEFCFPIASSVPFATASLAEPLSVGVYAAQRAVAGPGKTVAVLGLGPIGQITLQALKSFGVTELFGSDVLDNRVQTASNLGCKSAINSGKSDIHEEAQKFNRGKGFDIVIETAGAIPTLKQAVHLSKNGGMIVLVGNPPEEEPAFPIMEVVQREITITGSFRYANTYPTVVDILASNKNLPALISHKFPLSKTQEAFELVRDRRNECMKVVVEI
jgi:L-iditol 2-dehydrogenase